MMPPKELYNILCSVLPLYVTMFMAYAAVRWWRFFTGEQCYGINRFVSAFAFPFLTLKYVSAIDPGRIDVVFLFADVLSKLVFLLVLLLWAELAAGGSFDWAITLFSVAALPNTLVMGIPLITSMYGDEQRVLMVELVVTQLVVWNSLLLFLFEIRAARMDVLARFIAGAGAGAGSDGDVAVEVDQLGAGTLKGNLEQEVKVHQDLNKEEGEKEGKKEKIRMSWNTIKLIMITVLHKVLRNPNFYASLTGLIWIFVSSRWGIKEPIIIKNSISILSDTGSGMAMFSLGMFMALQPRIIACKMKVAAFTMFVRFVVGPSVVALVALLVGIKGKILKVTIVQAALSIGVVPFVFAREYDLHPEILSMSVSFGMIVAFPVTILYYIILDFLIA